MKRDEALGILLRHQEKLRDFGVRYLAIFGSVARDEARLDSDVDLLVEFEKPVGIFTFVRLQGYLETILGCSVDLGTFDSLKPYLREPILRNAVRAI